MKASLHVGVNPLAAIFNFLHRGPLFLAVNRSILCRFRSILMDFQRVHLTVVQFFSSLRRMMY
jgi:hypothetical protein